MTNSLSEQVAGLERQITEVWDIAEAWKLNSERHWKRVEELEAERDRLKADAISDLIKRHWLENQVRNREAERDELTRKNTLASWKANSLKFDHDKVAAERDDLQRQVQEARDEVDGLRSQLGIVTRERDEWEANAESVMDTLPRVITADELREGQTVAVWEPEPYGDVFGEVLRVHQLGTNEDGDTRVHQKRGGYWSVNESQIVVLEDAPDREGPRSVPFGNQHYHYAVLADGEVVKNSDMTPDAEATESVAHHRDDDHQDAEVTQWHESEPETVASEDGIKGIFTTLLKAKKAEDERAQRVWDAWRTAFAEVYLGQDDDVTHADTRLTVHDLEVAPAGSVLRSGEFCFVKRKGGGWSIPEFVNSSDPKETAEHLIRMGWDKATLTTPEAQ